jgi:hypothetical protein
MQGPTQQDYLEMLAPGFDDLVAQLLVPVGFAGRASTFRRDDGGIRHELRFDLCRSTSLVGSGALLTLSVTIHPRLAEREFARLVPEGGRCELRMPVELVEYAMGVRHRLWDFDSAESAAELLPAVARTLSQAVLPYLEPRRTAEGLLDSLVTAAFADSSPPDYQPTSQDAAVGAALALSLGARGVAERILVTAYGEDPYLRREYATALSVVAGAVD